MEDIFVKLLRTFLWTIAQFGLWLLDSVYDIMMSIAGLNIMKEAFVWNVWTALCTFIGLFVFIRVLAQFCTVLIDEEKREKMNPIRSIIGIGCICIVIFLMPSTMKDFNQFSVDVTNNVGAFISSENVENLKPSMIVIGDEKMNYQDININEKANGAFKYLPTTIDLCRVLVMGICAAVLMGFSAFMCGRRLFDLMTKILVSPFPISGLVNQNDQSFFTWLKLVIADLCANFVQVLVLYAVMKICVSNSVKSLSVLSQCFVLAGGLMAVLAAPNGIAQILGSDIGITSTLYQMSSMLGLAKGVSAGVKGVAAAGIGAGLTAAAAGVYGAGRALGGEGLLHAAGSAGGMLRNYSDNFNQGFGGLGDKFGFNNIGSKNPSYYEEPTAKQLKAANHMGIDPGNLTRGQLSQALERAGLEKSFWQGTPQQQSQQGFGSNSGAGFTGLGSTQPGFESQIEQSQPSTSRVARAVGEYGSTHDGFKGASARLVSTGSRHLYNWAGNQLAQPKRGMITGNVHNSNFVRASNVVHSAANTFKPQPPKANELKGPEL